MEQVFHVVMYVLAVGFVLLILFEIYRYIKSHPAQVKDLEDRLEALELKAEPIIAQEWNNLKALIKKAYTEAKAELATKPVVQVPAASPAATPPAITPVAAALPVAPVPVAPVPLGSPVSGYPTGSVLDSFYVPKVNLMTVGQPFVYQLEPPAGTTQLTFDLLGVVGTVASQAVVSIRNAAGTIIQGPSLANTSGWNSLVIPYSPGLTAEVTPNATGLLGGQMHQA